jgi:hypothetical protein
LITALSGYVAAVSEILTRADLNRATLARQLLLARADSPVVGAVQQLAGMQAQEPKHPYIGLWTRLENFAREDLTASLRDRSAVRATLMRGTLHLASARDYLAWRGVLAPMLEASVLAALRERAAGLEVEQVLPVARKLLDERPRGFDELRELLAAEFPAVNERALGFAVRMHMPLAMVPTDARWAFPTAADFTPADSWLGDVPAAGGDLPALLRAYLGAFGPASVADAQKWSGLKELKPDFEALRDELVSFSDERGRELFDLPGAPRPGAGVDAPVRFLPEFDNLVLAHDDRTRIVPDAHKGQVVTKNLRVRATFLVDGVVAGTWTLAVKRKVATVALEPFAKLTKKTLTALEAEGERLAQFVEPDAADVAVVSSGAR